VAISRITHYSGTVTVLVTVPEFPGKGAAARQDGSAESGERILLPAGNGVSAVVMGERVFDPKHPVREILQVRRASGSLPGKRDDPYKIGLAIEGGGLRGVVSGAMLVALEDLGYADAFDDVYSCSSGGFNGAYFVMRETWFPLSIYFDDLTSRDFLDFRRILRGRAPMRLEYLLQEVMIRRKPLDYPKVINSAQRLHVMITDVDALKTLDVTGFRSAEDLRDALRASAWLPLATKGTTTFRDSRAVDGAVLRRHPFATARADGCTHVLSLSTRPIRPLDPRIRLGTRLVSRYLERLEPGLGDGYLTAVGRDLTEDKPFMIESRLHPGAHPAVLDLAPLPGTPEVRRHETSFGALLQGARTAYQTVYLALEDEDVQVVPRLMVYRPR
jgi:predicted acylesterase/phospholipase RssA